MRFTVRSAVLVAAAMLALSACYPTGDGTGAVTGGAAEQQVSAAAAATGVPEGSVDADARADNDGVADPAVRDAVTTLATLEVKGRAPKTGYSRDEFGQRWKDIDRNGCDQRNDVLARDMTDVGREGPCKVMSGTLDDPYTATAIDFVRGQETSTAVQIDHVVAMSDAWQKGAQQLTAERREGFANDHLNLLAVDGPANMQKGDGDAATWLPANRPFRCTYVATQVQVKAKYDLWVTAAERDAISRELGNCGAGGIAPADEDPGPGGVVVDGEVYYENCTVARAAGAAPLYRGQTGYRPQMDGDKDGVACE